MHPVLLVIILLVCLIFWYRGYDLMCDSYVHIGAMVCLLAGLAGLATVVIYAKSLP
jgi:hypothetical protein